MKEQPIRIDQRHSLENIYWSVYRFHLTIYAEVNIFFLLENTDIDFLVLIAWADLYSEDAVNYFKTYVYEIIKSVCNDEPSLEALMPGNDTLIEDFHKAWDAREYNKDSWLRKLLEMAINYIAQHLNNN